jgi:SAM-dependent methyltransferase
LAPAPKADRGPSRQVLLARLPQGGVCAEVGSWKGDFAARILRTVQPRLLYLIDPWEFRGESEYQHSMYGGEKAEGEREMEAIYQSVLERFSAEIDRGQVIVMRMRSIDAVARLDDDSLDWAYIDSDHRYESVISDLRSFHRVVKPGGVLAGDDYGEAGWWEDGVTRAVEEFATSGLCGAPTLLGSQFLFTK